MPTNKKGGKGFKKAKKNSFQTPTFETALEGQFYAKINKKLGDRRFEIILHGTSEKTIGRARGGLPGGHNMKKDDIVLVSGRDFRNSGEEVFVQDYYDILQFYSPEQVRRLIKMNQITDSNFTEIGASNISYYENDEEESDGIEEQREYDMPNSESESEEDVDIDNL